MKTLIESLNESPSREKFMNHKFFKDVKSASISEKEAAAFIGQWWYPLHYFPTFLSRSISVFPDIESKCAIAKILNQETGEGNPKRAHEVVYIDSMKEAGFTEEQIINAPAFEETEALIETYRRSSEDQLLALGAVYATEVADLQMVSSIGRAVKRATGVGSLEWVKIHVTQEPDHVEQVDITMINTFSEEEQKIILEGAEQMWDSWKGFFDRLQTVCF